MERSHGRPSYGRCPIDPGRALGPLEMLSPALPARVEESHLRSGGWVNDEQPVPFVVVAQRTGKPEVILDCWPTK